MTRSQPMPTAIKSEKSKGPAAGRPKRPDQAEPAAGPFIVGVVGAFGAGNDTVRELLVEGLPAASAVTSDCLREAMRAEGVDINRDNLFSFSNSWRDRFGDGVWARKAWEKIQGIRPQPRFAAIGGIRSPAEVEELRRLTKGRFTLIAVSAPLEVRYQRVVSRAREGEARITLEELRAKEARENQGGAGRQNIAGALALADHRIENDGSFEQLKVKVKELITKLRALAR